MMNQLWKPEKISPNAVAANLAAAMEPYAPDETE